MQPSESRPLQSNNVPLQRISRGAVALVLGVSAATVPFFLGKGVLPLLGVIVIASGLLSLAQAYATQENVRRWVFFDGTFSVLTGFLLMIQPIILSGLLLLLSVSFLIDGMVRLIGAWRHRKTERWGLLTISGSIDIVLSLLVAMQWPFSGAQALGLFVGLHILGGAWALLWKRVEVNRGWESQVGHPDEKLGVGHHAEMEKLVEQVTKEEDANLPVDRWWRASFLLSFFAVHVGRMHAEWTLIGILSPLMAVLGDVIYALLLTYGVIVPAHLLWRSMTRPFERRAWSSLLPALTEEATWGRGQRLLKWWLLGRLRFSLRMHRAYWSPRAAVRRGLQIGLPSTAVLIAMNPIWGFSWYFNTENWATGVWEKIVEYRVDDWRHEMVLAVRQQGDVEESADSEFCRVFPEGLENARDFRFLVLGDPGEGDGSQHALRDQYLLRGASPDVRFMVISSDVIYPSGAMTDYEHKCYLPLKGFTKPVYAIPGNHDWYDGLEGFNANFLQPEAARAAMRARLASERRLNAVKERDIDGIIEEAARLRTEYNLEMGKQRAPYFELHARSFSLIAVDTGILRTIDDDQYQWLEAALRRARGKFKMVILGHPLYAAGHYQAVDASFARIHRLLRDHAVQVVMGGDTHDFEYYREHYEKDGKPQTMQHFVNGGGGAYLSIGTALDWPKKPATEVCAYYPRTDDVIEKLEQQTPTWKRPLWMWVKHASAWPSSPEGMAAAFDFNRSPFYQSFVEVHVSEKERIVRIIPLGVRGELRRRDLQRIGNVFPDGDDDDSAVFEIPYPPEE